MANSLFRKKVNRSCPILQTHKDVVTEIALHLPVQTLFRCRAVCKLWRDVIDSPFLRKLHIRNNKEEDEKVYLQLNYDKSDSKVSMKIIDNKGKSLNLRGIARFSSKCVTPLKGLICFNFYLNPIVICNPFLGQFKTLPYSPIIPNPNSSCAIPTASRIVAIGCDGEEFYKVVELVHCVKHRRFHAHLYSRRSDSWRELGEIDEQIGTLVAINLSSCNDGRFAHWYTRTRAMGGVILTFDMKNEVFRTTRIMLRSSKEKEIVAMDGGCSFIMFLLPKKRKGLVRIYESLKCEEGEISKLSWNLVAILKEELPTKTPPLLRSDCVMFSGGGNDIEPKVCVYDYVARRFVGCFKLPTADSNIFYYKGTFISP